MLRIALLGSIVACSQPATTAPASHTTEWAEDLHVLATELPAKHAQAFFHLPEAQWREQVTALEAKLPALDDAHVLVALARLVASLGDPHTLLGVWNTRGIYPLAFTWFDDGIYVTGAAEDWAIGRKLAGIGGHPVADVIAALTTVLAHDNLSGLHGRLPDALSDAALLAGADLTAGDRTSFSLAAADGSVRELVATPGKTYTPTAPPKSPPLHLQGPSLNYWNKYVAADKLLFFAYNACAEDPKAGPIGKLIEGTLGFVDGHPVDRFVIDLRQNEGGDSSLIEPLIEGLAKRPALAGKVYAIIGMHTFSSGMMAAMELKRTLHATLVGGPTAARPTGYGEIKLMTLPRSKLKLQYSTKLFENPDFPADAVEPDLPVKVTSADWFAGRDPALDAILASPAR